MADFAQLGIEVDSKGVVRARNELGRFTKMAKGTETATGKLTSVLKKAVIALGGFFIVRKLTRLMVGFETALAEVASISREVADNMATSAKQLRGFATFGKSATESAKGLYQVISAGVTQTADAFKVLEVATKASIAGLTSTATAVDVITSAINAYSLSSEDAVRVSDVLFTAVREGKTTFNELAGSMGRAMAIAAQAGVGFGELSAAVTTLTKGGISTDEAVTGIRATIVSILKPTTEASKFARRLGIDFSSVALKTKGLGSILREVKDAVDNDAAAMAKLFPNVRALAAVLAVAGGQSDEFVKQIENMKNAAGATSDALEIMADTGAFQAKRLASEAGSASLALLDDTATGAKGVLKAMADALEGVRRLGPQVLTALSLETDARTALAFTLEQEEIKRRKLVEAQSLERQEKEKLEQARKNELELAKKVVDAETRRLLLLENSKMVDAERHEASVVIIEDLLAERRELEITERELLKFNLTKIDANEGAKLRALAIFDETQALRKQREIQMEVADAIDGTTQSEQQLTDLMVRLQTALVEGVIPSYKEWEKLHNAVSNAMEKLGSKTKDTAVALSDMRKTMITVGVQAIDPFIDALFDAEKSAADAFKNIAGDFAKMVAKMLLQKAALKLVTRIFAPRAEAQGDAFSGGNVLPFARGGVVTQPTIFPMANGAGLMGEAGPEAVMPLTRTSGGDLGVKAEGVAPVVNLSIINNTGEVVTESRRSSAQGVDIEIMIGDSVKQHINKGTFDRSLQGSFGLSRKGISR